MALQTPAAAPVASISPDTLPVALTDSNIGDASVPVQALELRHDDHKALMETWDNLNILNIGGRILQAQAERFLLKRPKEMPDIYSVRIQHFRYHNLLGTGIGYYVAKLFEDDPEIDIKLNGESLKDPGEKDPEDAAPPAASDGAKAWKFYVDGFLEDCDHGKVTYVDFMRDVARTILLMKRCFVLIDLPTTVQQASNLAEQDVRPFLRRFDPRAAINWKMDQSGNLEWIMFRIQTTEQKPLKNAQSLIRWYYFDRKQFVTYEYRKDDTKNDETDQMAKRVAMGPHSMADYKDPDTGQIGRVPVHVLEVADDMWLGHRVYLPALDHLNTDNAYGWALHQANLAMPVIKSDTEYKPTLSAHGYIQIGKDDDFTWAEPAGTSFEHSKERIDGLREEIFRLMYLMAQGKSSTATASAQSGYSKQQDMVPALDALESIGDLIRAGMQTILELVGAVRQDKDIDFDVRGFDFEEPDLVNAIEETSGLKAIAVRSETFGREIEKDIVRKKGKDWNPEIVTKCCQEIDAAPTQEELDQKAQDAQDQSINSAMQASAIKLTIGGGSAAAKSMFPKPPDKPGSPSGPSQGGSQNKGKPKGKP